MTYQDDRTPPPRRRPVYISRGCDWRDGPCGAPDCPRCHPEWQASCPECGWRGYWEDRTACPCCGEEVGE